MNERTAFQGKPSRYYEAASPSLFSSLAELPSVVLRALRAGRESIAVQISIARGERSVNELTNMVFFARHPERKGRKLVRSERDFKRLAREWLDIRDRLVKPALLRASPPATPGRAPRAPVSRPLPGAGSRCRHSPAMWAREKLNKMRRWWADQSKLRVGTTLRRMTPNVLPGVPAQAIAGFCANGDVAENTTDRNPRQGFHEIGLFGTEAGPHDGPAPNPDPKAEDNSWGRLAANPRVVKLLGRRATMVPDAWKTAIPDQVAVGLVNLLERGLKVARRLDPSIKPNTRGELSIYFVACCFMGWSAGAKGAADHLNRFKSALAAVPERERWGAFLRAVATGIQSGRLHLRGLRKHRSVAFSAQRTWQKLAAGELLARETGGRVEWFDTGLGADEARIADTITCTGNIARYRDEVAIRR